MNNLEQLLINGFDLDYIPPDISVANKQEIADVIAAISENNKEFTTGEDIAKSLYFIKNRADNVIGILTPIVNAKTTTTDSRGKVVDLLSADEYLRLLKGSPNLTEINKMRLFESHHLSENGDLNVFVYEDALRIREELLTVLNSKTLISLVVNSSSIGNEDKLDPSNPMTTLMDYYRLKAGYAEKAMSSIEYTMSQTKRMPNYLSMVDSTDVSGLGFSTDSYANYESTTTDEFLTNLSQSMINDANISSSVSLMAAANRDKDLLKQCRAALKLLSSTIRVNLYSLIDDARNYAVRQGMREVNNAAVSASCEVYKSIINPVLEFMNKIESKGVNELEEVLKRVKKVNKRAAKNIIEVNYDALHAKIFESTYKYIYTFQLYMTELTQEDASFYEKHRDKSFKIIELRENSWFIQMLDEAIYLLDDAAASGDMNDFLEAYAYNRATDKVYDYAKGKFDDYQKKLKNRAAAAKYYDVLDPIVNEMDVISSNIQNNNNNMELSQYAGQIALRMPSVLTKRDEDELTKRYEYEKLLDKLPDMQDYINKWESENIENSEYNEEDDYTKISNYDPNFSNTLDINTDNPEEILF